MLEMVPQLAAMPDLDVHIVPHRSISFDGINAPFTMGMIATIHRPWMPRSWLGLVLWEQLVFPFIARRIGFDVVYNLANICPLLLGKRQVVMLQNSTRVG